MRAEANWNWFVARFVSLCPLGSTVGVDWRGLEHKLTLLLGCLVKLNQSAENGHTDSEEPALGSTSGHLLEFPTSDEFDLDQDGQVIKEPVEKESKTGQNGKVLLEVGQLSSSNGLDLDVLIEWFEQTEQFSGSAHIGCGKKAGKQTSVRDLLKRPSKALATLSLLPIAWNLMNLDKYWIILQNLSRPSRETQRVRNAADLRAVDPYQWCWGSRKFSSWSLASSMLFQSYL